MRYRYIIFLTIVVYCFVSFAACEDKYEHYGNNPNEVLSFSHDTLAFDTLFSTVGSTTLKLMVYNRHDKPLLISSIYLAGANRSGFRINVDGFSGISFNDIEILANDSMYVFVEATLDENGIDNPLLVTDSILFNTNTVTQQVILTGYGQDVYLLKGGNDITTDAVLPNNKPWLIYDSLVVRENAMLTIPEGVTLYMHNNAVINVYGTLKINGTLERPVRIRGDKLNATVGVSYDRLPGQWSGIYFAPESYNNEINHAHIRNGKYGLIFDASTPEQSKLKLTNSVLTNVYYDLFSAENCQIEVANCELSNAGGALLNLNGGKYRFTHCTIANYFVWSARTSAAVCLKNYRMQDGADSPLPLEQADFFNCIIYGAKTSEINLDAYTKQADIAFNYLLDYCLIKMEDAHIDPTHVTHPVTNKDPLFRLIDDDENYIFDFRLKENSPAIDQGNDAYGTLFPFDLDGKSRFVGEHVDMGAYEYYPSNSRHIRPL
ncbi:MAG: hypothetical protein LBM08_08155 [Dysgonamonadaceae bacterium]|jgi:hypothetical protein|nr:hypothetical protein [Dysgonamonadaceae bacterium]